MTVGNDHVLENLGHKAKKFYVSQILYTLGIKSWVLMTWHISPRNIRIILHFDKAISKGCWKLKIIKVLDIKLITEPKKLINEGSKKNIKQKFVNLFSKCLISVYIHICIGMG